MVGIHRRDAESAEKNRTAKKCFFAFLFALCVSAVNLSAAPQRIISTSPSITEMLYALGLGDRVVGVTTYCHYPADALKKTKVGNYLNPNLEVITSLRPDLIVAETTGVRRPERLAPLHLKVLDIRDQNLAEIYDALLKIGKAAGVEARAQALCAQMRASLDEIRRRTASLPRRRAIFVVGRTPGRVEDIIAAGRATFLNELIEIAGGQNVFQDSPAAFAKIGIEDLIARNPQVVIDMGEMSQTSGVTDSQKRAVVAMWGRYHTLAAVRERRVFAVANDIFVVPGPRVVEAAREFARMLHPEAGL